MSFGHRPFGQVAAGIRTLRERAAREDDPHPQAPHQPMGSAEPAFVRRCGQPRQACALVSLTVAEASPRNATLTRALAYRQALPRDHFGRASSAVMARGLGAAGDWVIGRGRIVPGGACGPM